MRIAITLLLLVLSGTARAAEPRDAVIVHTVQCEAGRAGEKLIAAGLPANLKVIVTWSGTETTDSAGSLGFKFPLFDWGVSGDLSKQQQDTLLSKGIPFNLNPGNLKVCKGFKKDIIKEEIGVYDCLINKKFESLRAAVEGGGGSTGCQHKVTLSKKVSGNLKLNVWGANLGPSASWGDVYVFNFLISAPKE